MTIPSPQADMPHPSEAASAPVKRPRKPVKGASRAPVAPSGYPESVQRLIEELTKLPGIGRRSAERLAFHVLKTGADEALGLARAISDVKRTVRHCAVCFNFADAALAADGGSLCSVCASPARDLSTVMVVEQPKDLISLERTGMYKGGYHVLMGRLSPLDGVGPADLTIDDLVRRAQDARCNRGVQVREVILALNPTLEADGTALYVAERFARLPVKVTRLARGIPTGSQLEFANKAVLADAIQGRRPM